MCEKKCVVEIWVHANRSPFANGYNKIKLSKRRFIFRTGVWYKTIPILYNDSYTVLSKYRTVAWKVMTLKLNFY